MLQGILKDKSHENVTHTRNIVQLISTDCECMYNTLTYLQLSVAKQSQSMHVCTRTINSTTQAAYEK